MHPIGNIGHFGNRLALMLLQKDNIRRYVSTGIVMESTVFTARQTDCTDQVSLVSQHLASAFIVLVKRSCRSDESDNAPVLHFVHCLHEEVIVKFRGRVLFVLKAQLTERDITHGNIKTAVLKAVFLKTAYRNIRIGIKCLCDTPRNAVDLHTVKVRAVLHFFWHTAEKVADTHCRLKDITALKAEVSESFINALNDCRAGIESIANGRTCLSVFLGSEKFRKLLVFSRPLIRRLIESLRYCAPAHIA